ncbi:MAG: metal-dependent transcriptional regulator [Planctomycetota bacterium]
MANEPQSGSADLWKEFDQNVVTHSAAHHLMAVADCIDRLGYARVSDVARQLNITRGSVSISLRPLKTAGLILQDENRHLRLSERGQVLVAGIRTKRLLLQRLLAEVLGVPGPQAEVDACKLEHLLSNATARQVQAFLAYLDGAGERARELLRGWQTTDDSAAAGSQPPVAAGTQASVATAKMRTPGTAGRRE